MRPVCDGLVLDLGSNDLSRVNVFMQKAVILLAELLFDWALCSKAKHVIFLGVLPGASGLWGSADHFSMVLSPGCVLRQIELVSVRSMGLSVLTI